MPIGVDPHRPADDVRAETGQVRGDLAGESPGTVGVGHVTLEDLHEPRSVRPAVAEHPRRRVVVECDRAVEVLLGAGPPLPLLGTVAVACRGLG